MDLSEPVKKTESIRCIIWIKWLIWLLEKLEGKEVHRSCSWESISWFWRFQLESSKLVVLTKLAWIHSNSQVSLRSSQMWVCNMVWDIIRSLLGAAGTLSSTHVSSCHYLWKIIKSISFQLPLQSWRSSCHWKTSTGEHEEMRFLWPIVPKHRRWQCPPKLAIGNQAE